VNDILTLPADFARICDDILVRSAENAAAISSKSLAAEIRASSSRFHSDHQSRDASANP